MTVCLTERLGQAVIPRANPYSKDNRLMSFYDSLSELERRVFESRSLSLKEIVLWRKGGLHIVQADPVIQNAKIVCRKRKTSSD
jgi:hypothetical protein